MARRKKPAITFPPVAFVADVHLGNFRQFGGETAADGLNVRGRLTLETLARALALAKKRNCSTFVVGGDLFEHRRPEPAIIAGAAHELVGYWHEDPFQRPLDVWVIPGNHDTIDGSAIGGNTACATVQEVCTVRHGWVDLPLLAGSEGVNLRLIPFNGGKKPMAQFVDEVMTNFKAVGQLRAVATHVGVVDDDTPPWLREAQDAMHKDKLFDAMDREDVAVAFVGNYHQHREWERNGRRIVQVGVLNPRGFGDAGLDDVGGIALWDGDKVTWEQVPGPRFVKIAKEQPYPESPAGCSVFARFEDIGVPPPDRGYAGFEVVPPEPEARAGEALPVKLVESAEEALQDWVARAPLPESVGKAEVADLLKDLWRKAA
jgi:calcineurin-like phosphoesterase family protein